MAKKQEPKLPQQNQEQPAEQQPAPMAAGEIDPLDRLEAVEIRLAAVERVVEKHHQYHFGKVGKD